LQRGKTDIDGDAACLLFRQPIAIDPGERFHQRRLAVVDMAGGAEDEIARHRSGPCKFCVILPRKKCPMRMRLHFENVMISAMRKFFLLSHQAYGDEIQTVEAEYNVGEFSNTRLWDCRILPEDFFEGIRLRVTPGKPCDFVPNAEGWPIVSPRMLACFQKFG